MTTFPAIEPASRVFTPGVYPVADATALAGQSCTMLNGAAMLASSLRLTFQAVTHADRVAIETHYHSQQGVWQPFPLPAETLSGFDLAEFSLEGYLWTYSKPPDITDQCGLDHDITVELETVPTDGAWLPGLFLVIGMSIVTSGATSGEPLGTITLSMQTSGAAAVPVSIGTIALSIATTGAEVPPEYGTPIIGTIALSITTTGTGATPYRVAGLHLDGNLTNVNADNIPTGNGVTFITTGQKYGTGAAAVAGGYSGSGLWLSTNEPVYYPFGKRIANRDFVFRYWIKIPNNTQTAAIAGNDSGNYSYFSSIIENSILKWQQSYNGTATNQTFGAVPVGQWAYIEIGRVAGIIRGSVDGIVSANTLAMNAAQAWEDDYIAAVGYGNQMAITMDDFEFYTGLGPRTADFTPPTAPFS